MLLNLDVILLLIVFVLVTIIGVWGGRVYKLRRLRQQGMFIFTVLAIVPVVVVTLLSIWLSAHTVKTRYLEQLRMAVNSKRQQLSTWLSTLEQTMLVELSHPYAARVILSNDEQPSEFSPVYRTQKSRFDDLLTQYPYFESLSLLDMQGEVVLSTDAAEEGLRYFEKDYFQQALSTLYVQIPRYGQGGSTAGIVARAVPDDGGETMGVLVARVSADAWYTLVGELTGLGETEEIYLTDAQHALLTPLRWGDEDTYAPTQGAQAALEHADEVTALVRNHRKREVLAIYRWVPELDALLVLELAAREAFGQVWFASGLTLGIAILAAVIAGGVAFVMARTVTVPVAELTDVMSDVARGKWSKARELPGKGDLARLMCTFNYMVDHLRERIEELESQASAQMAVLDRRSTQLETTMHILRQVVLLRDVDELLDLTVTQLSQQFGFYHVAVFLLDDSRQQALLRATSSAAGREMLAKAYEVRVGMDNPIGSVALQKKLRVVFDMGPDLTGFEAGLLPQTRSRVLIPLSVRDEVIGVLDIQSVEADTFAVGGTAYLQTVADQIALALDNARLLTATEERLQEIRQLLRGQSAEDWQRFSQEHPQWGYAYDGVDVKPQSSATFGGHSPQLVLPVQEGQQNIGVFKAFWEGEEPDPYKVELAREVIGQAGQALESARLFSRMQGALEEVGVLYRSSQALVAARTSEQVLRAFVDYLVAPGIDRCILALLEPFTTDEDMIVRIEAVWEAGKAKSSILGDRWAISRIPALVAVVRGEAPPHPLAISNLMSSNELDDVSRKVFLEIFRVHALLLVPLVASEQVLGWLLVESLHAPYQFVDREVRMYRSLADQAAIVLQSLRLLNEVSLRADHERQIAGIAAEIRRHTDAEAILQTSILELSKVLRAAEGFIQIGFEGTLASQTGDLTSEEKQ